MYDQEQRRLERLEATVYGNGTEGMQIAMSRVEEQLKSISECLAGIPDLVEQKVNRAIADLKPSLMDTDKVKLMVREAIEDDKEKNKEAPGSWAEFRKTWLFPVVMMVVSALISAGLTYIVVAAP